MNPLFIEAILRDSDVDRVRFQSYRAFLLLWLLFEAWISHLSGRELTAEKISWFSHNPNIFKDTWSDIIVSGQLNVLIRECPVGDKRYSPPRNPVSISDHNNPDLGEIIEVIYRIRCNLIHGKDDVTNSNNLNLYSACGDILYKWLRWTYHIAHKRRRII